MSGLQIGVLIYLSLSAILTVSMIGKERKPTTPAIATISMVVIFVMAISVILFGGN